VIRHIVDWLNDTFFVFWWIAAFAAVVATLTGWPVRRARRTPDKPVGPRHAAGVVACQQVGDDLVVWASEGVSLPAPFNRMREDAPVWAAAGMVLSEAALRVPVHLATEADDVVVDLAEIGTLTVSPACQSLLAPLGEELAVADGLDIMRVDVPDGVPGADARIWARREHVRSTGVDCGPTVVVLDSTGLVGPVPPGEGVALVRIGSPDGGWSVALAAHSMAVLEPAGIAVSVPGVTIIDDARGEDRGETAGEAPVLSPAATSRAEVDVLVLGDVTVRGGARPLDSARAVELVAYLALHDGVTDQRLKTALWPDRTPTTGTFNNCVSAARNRLGAASDGSPHVSHVVDGMYAVGRHVACDLRRFEAVLDDAAATPDVVERDRLLCAALELVRGAPFSAPSGYAWAYLEGFVARAEARIAAAAHELACLRLDAGDPRGALWATTRGLAGVPADEVLYRDRMRAHDLEGNPAAVDRALAELCEVIDADDPMSRLHPETIALYETVGRGRTRR
jgi:DNA-binding SARP family transcriptional activator